MIQTIKHLNTCKDSGAPVNMWVVSELCFGSKSLSEKQFSLFYVECLGTNHNRYIQCRQGHITYVIVDESVMCLVLL